MNDTGVYLQEDAIFYPLLLSCHVFHRVVALEAEMHIFVEIPTAVNQPATLIAARCRDIDTSLLQFGKWKEPPQFPN